MTTASMLAQAQQSVAKLGGRARDQFDTAPGLAEGGPDATRNHGSGWPVVLGRYNDADNPVRQLKWRWIVIPTLC
jgi:hypothetical protein